MERKALFFDIDGTILSELTGKVPDSTFDALKRAVTCGHLAFINTGRTIANIPFEMKRIPFSGYICGCGTYITMGDEVLFSKSIPHRRGREMVELMEKYHAVPILEGSEDCYFPKLRSRIEDVEICRRYHQKMGLGLETWIENDNYDYDKFVFFFDEQTEMEPLLENLRQDMQLIDRESGFYEVVPQGYSKASGIEFIMERFGLTLDDVYVFGDSSNDLPMFQFARHTAAMGKHQDVLDPYTEFVTKTVEEGGIAYALEHFGLI